MTPELRQAVEHDRLKHYAETIVDSIKKSVTKLGVEYIRDQDKTLGLIEQYELARHFLAQCDERPIEKPSIEVDHEGLPIDENEHNDKEILVYEISPHLTDGSYDSCIIRSYRGMLDFVSDHLETSLDNYTFDELLENPFTLTIGIKKMTVNDWNELNDD